MFADGVCLSFVNQEALFRPEKENQEVLSYQFLLFQLRENNEFPIGADSMVEFDFVLA